MINSISFNLKTSALQKLPLRKLKDKTTMGKFLTSVHLIEIFY